MRGEGFRSTLIFRHCLKERSRFLHYNESTVLARGRSQTLVCNKVEPCSTSATTQCSIIVPLMYLIDQCVTLVNQIHQGQITARLLCNISGVFPLIATIIICTFIRRCALFWHLISLQTHEVLLKLVSWMMFHLLTCTCSNTPTPMQHCSAIFYLTPANILADSK